MKKFLLATLTSIAGLLLFSAQTTAQESDTTVAVTTASAEISDPISLERLDALLAPIALYPDALLAQILMAATYPMDVIEAARWRESNPNVDGERLQDSLNAMDWDASVKSLVSFPNVLARMNEQPRWMQELGDAVLADQAHVMTRVQFLRQKARETGTLTSNDKQTVEVKQDESATAQYITIAPTSTQVIYVPVYDPVIVYGDWWWASHPVYWRPPRGAYFSSGFYWGSGYRPLTMLWGGFYWGGGVITINAPLYTQYYRVTPTVVGPYNAWWRPAPMYTPPYYYHGGHRVIVQHRPWYRPSARPPHYDRPSAVVPHPDHWREDQGEYPAHSRPIHNRPSVNTPNTSIKPPSIGTTNKPRLTITQPNTNNNVNGGRPPHIMSEPDKRPQHLDNGTRHRVGTQTNNNVVSRVTNESNGRTQRSNDGSRNNSIGNVQVISPNTRNHSPVSINTKPIATDAHPKTPTRSQTSRQSVPGARASDALQQQRGTTIQMKRE
ncbi:MAG: DUF3300 domain-containing protein [Burkholderiales bacterium]|jgi:hypothetical protein|nr:DUF3300 domain-containing protein [Burkholderiales bacterium]